MNKRKFYAAHVVFYPSTVPGDSGEARAIKDVYEFDQESKRIAWINEIPDSRVKLLSKVSKVALKHHKPIMVEFRSATRMGSVCWTWFYDNVPSWLL